MMHTPANESANRMETIIMSKPKKVIPAIVAPATPATPSLLDQTPPVAPVAATPAKMQFAYDAPSRELRWTFGAGIEDVTFVMPQEGELVARATAHGFKQRIADGAALSRNAETGLAASLTDKREAMARIVESLAAGEWELRATARKPKVVLVDVEALAGVISAARDKPLGRTVAWLEAKTEEQRTVFATSAEFAGAYGAAIAAKRPAKPLDEATGAELDAI